jgi:hypothetical protein
MAPLRHDGDKRQRLHRRVWWRHHSLYLSTFSDRHIREAMPLARHRETWSAWPDQAPYFSQPMNVHVQRLARRKLLPNFLQDALIVEQDAWTLRKIHQQIEESGGQITHLVTTDDLAPPEIDVQIPRLDDVPQLVLLSGAKMPRSPGIKADLWGLWSGRSAPHGHCKLRDDL